MRPILPGCLDRAAAALLTAAPGGRAGLSVRIVAEARAADAWRKRRGWAHPLWGDGSLMSAAGSLPLSLGPETRGGAAAGARCP